MRRNYALQLVSIGEVVSIGEGINLMGWPISSSGSSLDPRSKPFFAFLSAFFQHLTVAQALEDAALPAAASWLF